MEVENNKSGLEWDPISPLVLMTNIIVLIMECVNIGNRIELYNIEIHLKYFIAEFSLSFSGLIKVPYIIIKIDAMIKNEYKA